MESPTQKTVLSNGIRILTRRMDHVRSVSMGIWVNVGTRDETGDENGLSHFIEHMIFKGTKKRSAFQIAKEFDAIGGYSNAFTSMEHTCYHAKVLDTHTETMADILLDIFLNSVFDPEEIERERPVILQEIGMVEDSPDEFLHVLLAQDFWGEHPLGRSILGSRENVARFDAERIRRFFNRFYRPEQIVVSVAGNQEHQRIIDLVAPVLESVLSGEPLPPRTPPSGRRHADFHSRDLEQVHIGIGTEGLSVTDPRRFAFSLMNTILGGNMSSRLFQEIRERRGLAYTVYSFISSHVDTGMFGVYTAVDPKTTAEAIRLILAELGRLKEMPVDQTELNNAREYAKGNLLLSAESSDNQMMRLAQNEINHGRHIPIQEVLEKIDAVSREEILALAGELLRPDRLTVTLLGPASGTIDMDELVTL